MEGNKFDPMTGQPIVGDTVENAAEEVKEVANEAAADVAQTASDAEQSVSDSVQSAEDTVAQSAKKIVSYDPMTGAPVYEGQAPSSVVPVGAVPEKKKGKGGLIAAIVAAVVVIAAIVVGLIFLLGKGKPSVQIYNAFENTFNNLNKGENLLLTALSPEGLQKAETFTLSAEGGIYDSYWDEEATGSIDMIKSKDALQINLGVDLSDIEGIPYIDANIQLDNKTIKVASSLLQNVYVYDYTKEPDGYIGELLEQTGMEASDINDAIKDYYDMLMDTKGLNDINTKLIEDWKKSFHDLKIEKAGTEEFEINGKDVKCKGYTITITEEDMEKFIDSYADATRELYNGSFQAVLGAVGTDADEMVDEIFGDIYDTIEDMDDVEFDVYLYKNALAGIIADIDGEKVTVSFLGGDYRAQNIQVKAAGSKIKISSKINKNVEEFSVDVDKETYFSYEFDSKSGDLSFTVNDGWDEYEFDGINVKSKSDEVTITLDDFTIEDEDIEINGALTFKKAAKLTDISGKEFDLGSASEDEIYDIIDEESEAFEELGLY